MLSVSFLWAGYDVSDFNKWNLIRNYRNSLLQQCDWTQLPDISLTNDQKLIWSQYRQMLRNVTEDFTNPDDVIFPEAPNG